MSMISVRAVVLGKYEETGAVFEVRQRLFSHIKWGEGKRYAQQMLDEELVALEIKIVDSVPEVGIDDNIEELREELRREMP